jgi:16S rRNA (uracil1498-N3)-methyltransferase
MIRLFVSADLSPQSSFPLDEKQSHYIKHVMRQNDGDTLLVFNGRDGEWRATLTINKKSVIVTTQTQTRAQINEGQLTLIFAPIKRGHGDITIEKASELGASALYPIITDRTVISRIPTERYEAIAIEAAEQCERLSVPKIHEAQKLDALLKNWNEHKHILLCAEQGEATPLASALASMNMPAYAVMVGPEGGFSEKEFSTLRALPFITPVSLGPRILRADTAAISALSIIQALKNTD